ncbi:MAG: beta strand repeat-containing protein [Thermoplasmata archaeon]
MSGAAAAYTVTATGSDGSADKATATFPVTTPGITLTLTQGPSGVSVGVSGTGFTPGKTVATTIGAGAAISACGATVTATGTFSCTVTITGTASATPYTVTATGSDGSFDKATATFTITLPSVTLVPTQGPGGVVVTASGSGFTPSSTITFTITSGGTIGSASACTATGTGTFSGCTLKVGGAAAAYTVTATGSDGSYDKATAAFLVTTPTVVVSPAQGPVGATYVVTGSGFSVSSQATVLFNSVRQSPGGCSDGTFAGAIITTDTTGGFACTFTVPTEGAATYDVAGEDYATNTQTTAQMFTVTAPTITLAPTEGPSGVSVGVSGTGFTPGMSVTTTIGAGATISACGATVTGTGTFSCTVTITGTASATPYTVTATGSDGSFDKATVPFTISTPRILLVPTQGPSGVSVGVSGTGFTPGKTVTTTIGAGATIGACGATVSGTGTFSCSVTISGTASATPYTVTAAGSDGSFDQAAASFKITTLGITLTLTRGPSGVSVGVSGTGFTPGVTVTTTIGAGATIGACGATVSGTGTFGCTVTVSGTSSATPYTVTATGSDGSADSRTASFTITTPTMTLVPSQGPTGITVTLEGSGFTPSTDIVTLTFNGATPVQTCTGQVTSGTGAFSCTFTVPSDSASSVPYSVVATGSDGAFDSATANFTVTAPGITVTPGVGPVGATVTVAGTGFSVSTSLTSLVFDSLAISSCPGGGSLTTGGTGAFSCTFVVPSGTFGTTVTATDASGQTATGTFSVTIPAITVSPAQGPIDVIITVTGTGFSVTSPVGLVFDGVTIASCTSGSLTTDGTGAFGCAFGVPNGASGTTVTATDVGGQTATGAFLVTGPTIAVSPTQGPVGAPYTVTGSGFSVLSEASVLFNSVRQTPVGCSYGTFAGTVITTNTTGGFVCTFTVPNDGAAAYGVTAEDSATNSPTAAQTFTVTIPTISVSPAQGLVGTSYTVTGSGFSLQSGATLTFDSSFETPTGGSDCDFVGPTITTDSFGGFVCTFTVSSLAPGSYPVVGEDVATSTPTSATMFTVTVPSIAVTPAQGPVGATVTVSGTGFSVSTALESLVFDAKAITSCTNGSLTTSGTGAFTCTFRIPSGTSGTTVTARDASGQTATGAFTVTTPTISVGPTQGPVGVTVTVSGTGFSVTSAEKLVFDGVSVVSCASGSLTTSATGAFDCVFSVPGGTFGTTVIATDPSGQTAAGAFAVTTPTITVGPTQGPLGTKVTVSGTGFSVSTPLASLVFDSQAITTCTIGSLTTSGTGTFTCTFSVPSGASGTTVTATDASGPTATSVFTVTTPAITVSPVQGPVGAIVTVSGTGFSVLSTAGLLFDGVSIATCTGGSLTTSATGAFSCTFQVPSETAGATVTAGDVGGQTATATFALTTPAITVSSPTQGPVGATAAVSGTGFSASSAVGLVFDGVTIASCTGGSLTAGSTGVFSCTLKVPTGTTGTTVTATDVGGQTATGSYTVTSPLILVSPAQGPVGATFTVTGSGFSVSSGATVSFDGTLQTPTGGSHCAYSGWTITTDTTGGFVCTFTVPSEPAGAYTVVGNDTAASASTSAQPFTVTVPTIAVSPAQAPVGATVTVSGMGFSASSPVGLVFDGVMITNCTAGSLTTGATGSFSCTFAVPSGTSGTTVTAKDVGGQTASANLTVTSSSSSSSSWWIYVVIALAVIVVVILVSLLFRRRRPSTDAAVPPAATARTASEDGAPATAVPAYLEMPEDTGEAPPPVSPTDTEPDMPASGTDPASAIAEIDQISTEIVKKAEIDQISTEIVKKSSKS